MSTLARDWLPHLVDLSDRIRAAARGALLDAVAQGSLDAVTAEVRQGVGDVTYGLDVAAERALDLWFEERARESPLSLLTEDSGWRHAGPGADGRTAELPGFDHGGPRIVVDPVDGTRMLMTDLRPAWSVIALAPSGRGEPKLSGVELGVLAELPDSRAARFRRFVAVRGEGCRLEERALADGSPPSERVLRADADARPDRGFFAFFRYLPAERPEIARIEADFFARLADREGADVRTCFDDQYISNGGQIALLALGTYRMIADLRAFLAKRRGSTTFSSKPYDVAGAILCAREAGCVLVEPAGSALDFVLDAKTPVSFVGWANAGTRERLAPHFAAALGAPR